MCNSPVSVHCQLTRKRPLLVRGSLGREQRDIPGLVREWSHRYRELGLLGRDSLERPQREVPGPVRQGQKYVGTAGALLIVLDLEHFKILGGLFFFVHLFYFKYAPLLQKLVHALFLSQNLNLQTFLSSGKISTPKSAI